MMTPEQKALWRQADQLLEQLLEHTEHPGIGDIDALELNDDLRQRLIALVDSLARGPLAEDHQLQLQLAPAGALIGRQIGDWIVEKPIGTGGSATVYRARRSTREFEQNVALKLLNLGQLGTDGAARFEREKQLLAELRHPNIASLLDAGVAEDGTPFIAMEYIDGERIDDFCDANAPNVKDKVRLFLQVALAVAFAQRNLIVHRDIKPSNVLVDLHGDVKLLDFGIARLIGDNDEATTTRAFTPGYAAPEQLNGEAISTATDVFGLGALLYKLLTGEPAFPRGERGPYREPVAPRQIQSAVDSDLSNIVLKALRPQPEDRYSGAERLADDLRAWLEGRPVAATPGSRGYRLRRYIARHRTAMIGVLAAVAVGGTGLVTTVWQAREASRQASLARQEAQMVLAATQYLEGLIGSLAPATPGAPLDKAGVIDDAVRRAQAELSDDLPTLNTVLFSLAESARELGLYEQSKKIHQDVLQRRQTNPTSRSPQDLAKSQLATARLSALLGESVDAVNQQFDQALKPLRSPLDRAWFVGTLAQAAHLGRNEQHQQALALLDDALAVARTRSPLEPVIVADLLMTRGEMKERLDQTNAAADYQQALDLLEAELGPEHTKVSRALALLGGHLILSDAPAALSYLNRAVALDEEISSYPTEATLDNQARLANAYHHVGDVDRALSLWRRHLEDSRSVFGDPSDQVASALSGLGSQYFARGRFGQARSMYQQAHIAFSALYDPQHAGALIARANYGDTLRELGEFESAYPIALESLAAYAERFGIDSFRYGNRLNKAAQVEFLLGKLDSAEQRQQRSLEIYAAQFGADHQNTAFSRSWLAEILRRQGRRAEAIEIIEETVPVLLAGFGPSHRYSAPALYTQAMLRCPGDQCEAAIAAAMPALTNAYHEQHWTRVDLASFSK